MAKNPRPSEARDSTAAPAERPRRSRRVSGTADSPSESLAASTGGEQADEPTDEEIRLRAYHRYLQRGGGHGEDFEDWLEAEKELKQKK